MGTAFDEQIARFDEFTAGDAMRPLNKRKTMVVSFSFMELGMGVLQQSWGWITFATLRSKVFERVKGGWSHAFRLLLRRFLLTDTSMNRAGVPMLLGGQHVLLYADVRAIMTDLDGWRLCLDWYGANGHKPCMLCKNVWKKDLRLLPGQVDITCYDPTRFEAHSHDSLVGSMAVVIASADRVSDGRVGVREHKDLEQGLGFKPNALGLLADAELMEHIDVHRAIRTDWMHDYFQYGCFHREFNAFLRACQAQGVGWDFWRRLLSADWRRPRRTSIQASLPSIQALFSSYAEARGSDVKPKASEWLCLYVIVRHAAETKLGDVDDVGPQRASFEAACSVIDAIMDLKRNSLSDFAAGARAIRAAQQAHRQARQTAYGNSLAIPKDHMCLHIADQIERDRAVYDMFVVERLNKRTKSVADNVQNTTRYEFSVLASLVTKHLNDELLRGSALGGSELQGRTFTMPTQRGEARLANVAVVDGEIIAVDDIVMCSMDVGMVVATAECHNTFYLMVRSLQPTGERARTSATYKVTDVLTSVVATGARVAQAWYPAGGADDEFVVLW